MKYLKYFEEMVNHYSQTNDEPLKAERHPAQIIQDEFDQRKEKEKGIDQQPPNPLIQSLHANQNANRNFNLKDYKEFPVMKMDEYILHLKKKA